jgi:hypothetical protein
MFRASGQYYFPVKKRYDPDGRVEDVAENFNATLDSDIFPNLGLVESFFGMPAGSGNIGQSKVDFEYQYSLTNYALQYGITDRLTAGINIPYWWSKNSVRSSVDTSKATLGKSAIGAGLGAPVVPLAGGGPFGDAVPFSTEDLKDILGGGVDVDGNGTIDIPGFGYKRFKTWHDESIGDIEAGFRYQYLKTKNWRLAFTGGVRFPTGHRNDQDNLVDFTPFSYETHGLLFRTNNDFTGLKNHLFNATFRYDLLLPDKRTMRVLTDVNNPLTRDKERVDRDLGDILEIEVSDKYTPYKGLNIMLLYAYKWKWKDDIDGDMGFAYEALEDETRSKSHVAKVGLSYSTVPLFLEKKFPIPMSFDFTYRQRFAGSDNAIRSKYIEFGLNIFF